MTVFLLALTAWALAAGAVLVLLARGRRRRDRQHDDRQRALRARQAARPDASWGRDGIPGPTAPDRPADGRTRPRHRRPR